MKPILLLGDAHLREGDSEVEAFLDFLKAVPSQASALYLLGDLFDLWIGSAVFLSDCHRRVVSGLEALRASGVDLIYVEGNRDYRLGSLYESGPFRLVAEDGVDVSFGARHIHLAHGDLVNREDWPYRAWRRFSRGPVPWGIFRMLPDPAARSLANRLEIGIARTNRRHRRHFPEEHCRRFALEQRRRGADTVVLGHFHREARLEFGGKEGSVEVFILPAWGESRRCLRLEENGSAGFVGLPEERSTP